MFSMVFSKSAPVKQSLIFRTFGYLVKPTEFGPSLLILKRDAAASIVVTKSAEDFGVHNTKRGKDLIRIPAFAFLYLLGHAEKHGYRGMDA